MKASLQYRVHQDLKAAIELRAKRQRADPGDLVRATLSKEFLPELNEMDAALKVNFVPPQTTGARAYLEAA